MNLIHDNWLSEVMEREVFRTKPGVEAQNEITAALETIPMSKKVFLYAKVPAHDLVALAMLTRLDFAVMDTLLVFEKSNKGEKTRRSPYVRRAVAADEDQVVWVAQRAFSSSRFHLDTQIGKTLANQIKEAWVRNYFGGQRGFQMLVAVDADQKVGGFLLLLKDVDNSLRIDLIAVDPKKSGKGLGQAMVETALAEYPDAPMIRTGTQIINQESIRFYEKNGFRFCEAEYVLHRHETGRAPA